MALSHSDTDCIWRGEGGVRGSDLAQKKGLMLREHFNRREVTVLQLTMQPEEPQATAVRKKEGGTITVTYF